ncbi:unnamed protein product [Cyprideis torosa]|uniref:Uncharacterized protein n=1 Tax=Cyprideis torosa TaxID=163714 RepID=A0A7R8ZY58_9CRUS|nr:unnamed protein product [Cyprideis torosa]CAG0911006.1 unnamed protein product [Cyprideis torosa]
MEDLLKLINRCDGAHGIDVGAGAIAIYSLLAAKRNKWRMLATDTSTEAANHAKATVEANGLQDYISVLPTDPSSPMFPSAPPDGQNAWDFSLCNPPFFDSRPPSRATDDGEGGSVGSPSSAKSRPGRPPPPHAPTGKSANTTGSFPFFNATNSLSQSVACCCCEVL